MQLLHLSDRSFQLRSKSFSRSSIRMASEEDDLLLGAEAKSMIHQNFEDDSTSGINMSINRLSMTGKAGMSATDNAAEDVNFNLQKQVELQAGLPHQDSQNSEYSVPINSLVQILDERKGDPEMILHSLGFSGSYSDVNCRIPDRFLLTPSKAYGISVEKFLDGNPKLREFLEGKNAIQNPFEMMMTSAEGQSDNLNSEHVQLLSHFQQLISNLIVREVPLPYLASCAALIRGLSSTDVHDRISHTFCQIIDSHCGLQQNRKTQKSARCSYAEPVTQVPSDSSCITFERPSTSHQQQLQAAKVTVGDDEDISKQGFFFADSKSCHKQSDHLRSDIQLDIHFESNSQLNVHLKNSNAQLNDFQLNDHVENHAQPNDHLPNETLLNDHLGSGVHLCDPLKSDVVQNDFDPTRDWKSNIWSRDCVEQSDLLEDGQWRVGTEDHSGSEPDGVLQFEGDERRRRSDAYTSLASCEFVKLYFGQRCLETDEEGSGGEDALDLRMDWCMPEMIVASDDRGFNRGANRSQNKGSRCASVEFVDADDYCYIDDCLDIWPTKTRTEFNDEERGTFRDRENVVEEQSTTGAIGGYEGKKNQAEDFYVSHFEDCDDEYFYDDVLWPTESLV